MSPIEIKIGDLHILSVKGKGEELSNYFIENEDGEWEKVNNEDALLPEPANENESSTTAIALNTKKEVIMDAGGPVLSFDTNGPRYLYASVEVSFFDFITTEMEAEISNSGMSFFYNYRISDILEMGFDLSVNWTGQNPGFSGTASFDFDLDFEVPLPFDLPSIELDASLNASATVKVDTEGFLFKINGGFEFEGTHLTIPEIKIEVAFASLKDIGQMIIDFIIENAWEIFKEIFAFLEEAWEDFTEGVEFLYNETKELVEDIAAEAEELAVEAIAFANKTIEKAEEVLEDIGEEIVQAYEDGKQFVEDTAEAIVQIGKDAAEAFEDFVEGAGAVIDAAEKVAEEVYKEAKAFVENVGHEIVAIGKEAVKAVKQFAEDAAKFVKGILDDAVKAAQKIWDGVKDVVEGLLRAAKRFTQLAEQIWNEINQILADIARELEEAAEAAVEWVGGAVNDLSLIHI